MKWMDRLNESIKKTVRSWLNVVPANPYSFQINELMDFEAHAIRNRIWYRGDGNELEQFYQQNAGVCRQVQVLGLQSVLLEWTCERSTPVYPN